jgi:hypothetical protein
MAKGSDNPFPSVLVVEGTVPSSPAAGRQRVYIDSADSALKRVNSSGTVTLIEGAIKGVLVTKAAVQNIANNTTTTLTFDTETYDNDTMHAGGNPERITFTTTGKYYVTVSWFWASNASGYRALYIRLNGATLLTPRDIRAAVNADESGGSLSFDYSFSATDYIEARAFQNSGGALDITAQFAAHQLKIS